MFVSHYIGFLFILYLVPNSDSTVICQPNLKIIRGCSECVCNAAGNELKCDKKTCTANGHLPVPPGAVLGQDVVCKPDGVFEVKDQCNKCKCSSGGNGFGCEEIEGCIEKNPEKEKPFNMRDYLPMPLPSL